MTLDLPVTVWRFEGSTDWHFRFDDQEGHVSRVAPCGQGGRITGLAIGTKGLEVCDACVEVVQAKRTA